jgi:DeoR/GlpR family transcriptional regulator of sugar metabolism
MALGMNGITVRLAVERVFGLRGMRKQKGTLDRWPFVPMMCSTLFSFVSWERERVEEPTSPPGAIEAREMIPAERRARIVEILGVRRAVRVSLLSEELGVSEMTVRRDLERLEAEGVLSRTHGGAIMKRHMVGEPLYVDNVLAHAEEKRRIAKAAAAMIQPGETVFLSSGTTAAQVLRHVGPQLEARVVTHNAGTLAEAAGLRIELVLLGGVYRYQSNTLEGSLPAEVVAGFYASKMILCPDGMSLEEGLTGPSIGVSAVERAMVRQTRGEVVVLVDSSKIGVVADVAICPLDRADVVVVDDGVGDGVLEELKRLGLRVVVV